jgi:uncharacterized protein YidB (DUF937 family)
VKALADLLGMSADDLTQQLGSGKSLNDLADEQGVSHDDLITTIKQGLPADTANGAENSTENTDSIAEKIAGTVGMPPPPPGRPMVGGPKGENTGLQDDTKLQQVSDLLEMDTEDVTDQATSAATLVSLLQSKGVDLKSLRSVLDSGDLLDVAA